MQIYIPSRSRAAEIKNGPAVLMPPDLQARVIYVVPPEQVGAYAKEIERLGLPCAILPCVSNGIARTRAEIGRHAASIGYDKFVMLDDDIDFLIRKSEDDWPLRAQTHDEIRQMFAEVERLLDDHAHVGVSGREGNNRVAERYVLNTRIIRFLAYQTREFNLCEHGRVDVMEDFDVALQLLGRGLSNACLYYYAQGQKKTQAPGGCSDYRTHENHSASAHKLAEFHAPFVRLRTKQNKTDQLGFGTRTEVTIAWKKAYEAGLAARETALASNEAIAAE